MMFRTSLITAIFAMQALIQGCGGLVVAGAAVGAVAVHDMRPSKTMLEDQGIELTATDLIYSDDQLQTKVHINVHSYNHIVLVTGEALSQDLRARAVDIVRNLNNVRRVHNEIRIADLTTFEARTKDSWISSKVKTRMLATENFDATRIKVITESRTVYLMGLVSQEQGSQAAEIASKIEGVERVIKLFEYVEPVEDAPKQAKAFSS